MYLKPNSFPPSLVMKKKIPNFLSLANSKCSSKAFIE